MKKLTLLLPLLAILPFVARAADLSGAWRFDLTQRGGVSITTYFILRQNNATIDGTVIINTAVDLPLRRPRVEGTDVVFDTDWNMNYRLHPEGEKLGVTLTYGDKRVEKGTAYRVEETEARPPAVLPLPPLEAVPANGLALSPPMGWNSWNHFRDRVDDVVVRAAADTLVSSGLAAAGYVYVNIDDSWEGKRDAEGNITANEKFPNMKALAAYVHSRGLKLGLYTSPGPRTCGGYEGSYGHEEQDAKTYAAWGIDYLKHDWCSAARVYTEAQLQNAFQLMGRALARSGRPIVYSLCEYGMGDVWKWGPQVGANLWRTTGDIEDTWKSMSEIGFNQSHLAHYAGPGHWNDPDMLEVGNGGMTTTEYRTHFSLWCLLAAPLLAGNDLSIMSPETLEILGNREVIAIDQDALGRQGERLSIRGALEIWTKPLHDGSLAVGIFNRSETEQSATFTWTELGRSTKPTMLRDLWSHRERDPVGENFPATVPSHGVVLLRMK